MHLKAKNKNDQNPPDDANQYVNAISCGRTNTPITKKDYIIGPSPYKAYIRQRRYVKTHKEQKQKV
jgi:hypothetical protein